MTSGRGGEGRAGGGNEGGSSVVVWLDSACRSMMPLCRALHRQLGGSVRVVLREALSEPRRALGWTPDSAGPAPVEILADEAWAGRAEAIVDAERDALHLVGAYQRGEFLRHVAHHAATRGRRMAILSEAPLNMDQGPRRVLKEAYLRAVVPRRVARIIAATERIFCLSGRRFEPLEALGWPAAKISAFGYFPEDRGVRSRVEADPSAPLRLLSTGFLQAHKGVDLLLEAAARLKTAGVPFECDITGEGPELARLEAMRRRLRLEPRVRLHGIVSDARLAELMAAADVLVVPGRWEPWGIRVNEGIQAGLAVVVSDRVGAAELIAWSGAGRVFRSGDAGELGLALSDLARDRRLLAAAKRAAGAFRPWIAPEQAARHLLAVCAHPVGAPEPVAPWASGEAREAILEARGGDGAGSLE